MKKKILKLILPTALVFALGSVNAAEITDNVNINLNFNETNRTISISGDMDILKNKIITAKAVFNGDQGTDSGYEVVGFTQVQTDNNGSFSLQMPLANEAKSGWYTINIGGQFSVIGDGSCFERRMYYINEESFYNAVQSINKAESKEEIIEVFSKNTYLGYAPKGNEAEYFYKLVLERKGLDETKDFEELKKDLDEIIELSYLFEKINTGTDIENSIVESAEIFGIENSEAYKDEMSRIFIAGKYSVTTEEETKDVLNKIFILAKINSASYEELTDIIMSNKSLLGINTDEYSKKDKITVNKQLVRKGFTSIEDFQNAFNKALNSSTGSGNGSGSGSSGGSGGRKTSGGTNPSLTIPTTSVPVQEVKQTEIFNDLEQAVWAKDSIIKLYNKNIISGKSENEFCPNDFITREEFATIAVKAFDIYDTSAVSDFIDVAEDAWYAKYVASAKNNEIIAGNPDGSFGVGALITREDMATILFRLAKFKNMKFSETKSEFDDYEEISTYAQEAVSSLCGAGIINGVGDNKFAPKENATRAQAVKMIELLMEEVMN